VKEGLEEDVHHRGVPQQRRRGTPDIRSSSGGGKLSLFGRRAFEGHFLKK